jgi:hypothetical protein
MASMFGLTGRGGKCSGWFSAFTATSGLAGFTLILILILILLPSDPVEV